jgi:hypothetical protein
VIKKYKTGDLNKLTKEERVELLFDRIRSIVDAKEGRIVSGIYEVLTDA